MTLQSTVNTTYALGVPGDPATPDQAKYYALNLPADASGVYAGRFVSRDADDCATLTVTTPLGIVQRNMSYFADTYASEGTLKIPAGQACMIAVKGDFYVQTKTPATVGQKVFASTTTGEISTGEKGGSVSGCVETDWTVVTAGAADDIIVISND